MIRKTDEEVISIFKETKALLTGHFILRSGLRSGHFFQCAQVCQHMDKVTILAKLLLDKLECPTPNTIVAPAMGGLVLGQEVARQLNCRFLFLANGALSSPATPGIHISNEFKQRASHFHTHNFNHDSHKFYFLKILMKKNQKIKS